MTTHRDRFGLSAAMATPFREDGSIDLPRAAEQASWCLANGCASITAFGTTGEGASIGNAEREQFLGALAGTGITGEQVVACVASSAVHEALDQARMALEFGCRALLLPPPFYFKGVSDDGLYSWYGRLIEGLGAGARDIILYHIPPVTQIPISVDLVTRLRKAFPDVVIGVKDSSGDWTYTQQLLAEHGELAILIGDERYLAEGVRHGGEGAISGLANICPQALLAIVRDGADDERVNRLVDEVLRHPVVPAVKALVSHRTGDRAWLRVRAPLVPLGEVEAAHLGTVFDELFTAGAS